jgi:hypothetical protein
MDCASKFSYLFDAKFALKDIQKQFDAIFDGKLNLVQTKTRAHRVVYNDITSDQDETKKFFSNQKRQYSSYAVEFNENIVTTNLISLNDLFFSRFSYADGRKIKLAINSLIEEKDNNVDSDDCNNNEEYCSIGYDNHNNNCEQFIDNNAELGDGDNNEISSKEKSYHENEHNLEILSNEDRYNGDSEDKSPHSLSPSRKVWKRAPLTSLLNETITRGSPSNSPSTSPQNRVIKRKGTPFTSPENERKKRKRSISPQNEAKKRKRSPSISPPNETKKSRKSPSIFQNDH